MAGKNRTRRGLDDYPLEPGEEIIKPKLKTELQSEIDRLLPTEYDDFVKVIEGKEIVKNPAEKNIKMSTYDIKKRAYELIIKGHSSMSYIPMLVSEFNINRSAAFKYVDGLRDEVKVQYNEVNGILRESILMELIDLKNSTPIIMEKLKCLDMIIKITGLSNETINVNQNTESRTFVITQTSEDKKEGE